MNGVQMLQGLPNNVPFVPQVEVRDNLRQQVKRITGEILQYMQTNAYANTLVRPLYEFIGQNGFNNPAFVQLVQDSVIIIDYMMSNSPTPMNFESALKEAISVIGIGASSSYASRNQQFIHALNNPNLQQQALNAAAEYQQLSNTAKNWFQGAKMTQFYPQQMPMYGQPQMPGYQYAPAMQPQMPGMPMYGQPIYGMSQQMPMYAQAAMARPGAYVNPQQMMQPGQQFQPQYMPPQPQMPYQPQVAGGYMNPQMPQQMPYQAGYGFTQPTQGPRAGGLGTSIPGVNNQQPQAQPQGAPYQPQSSYQPQAAYAQQPNLGNPQQSVAQANVGQNLPNQGQYQPQHAPIAPANVNTQQPAATMTPVNTQPVQQQPKPTSTPVMISSERNTETRILAGVEEMVYRIPNGSGLTRLPFMYDYTTEGHKVSLNTNGEVISQSILPKDELVNLSEHDTTPYFLARTVKDLVSPNLKAFTTVLDRTAVEVTATSIMEKIAALQDKDEEEIARETAIILRDNLSDKLLVLNDCFVMTNGYKVNPHDQFRTIAAKPIAAKLSEISATYRAVVPFKWGMTGTTAKIAHSITTAKDVMTLHQQFCALVEILIPVNASPLIDEVTEFVNTEIRRYFGLDFTMSSFCLDFQEVIATIELEEGAEFAGIVCEHLLQRLTSTILYAYTPKELNEVCRNESFEDDDSRIFARVDQVVLLPVRSRDIPYTYNGRAGLILNTSYQALNRLITKMFESAGAQVSELQLHTLDGDTIRIHPIMNDNSYVMYKTQTMEI